MYILLQQMTTNHKALSTMNEPEPYSTRQAILDAVAYVRRRGRWASIVAAAVGVIGLVLYLLAPREYRAEMALRCYLLKSSSTVSILKTLQNAVSSSDSIAVARSLRLSPSRAAQLRNITPAQPKYIQPEDANEVLDVYISVDVIQPSMFDSLTIALPRFIDATPLVDSLRRTRLAALNANLFALRKEKRTLDSLRALAGRALANNRDAKALGDLSSGTTVISLLSTIRTLEQDALTLRGSLVTSPFVVPSRPFYPRILFFVFAPAVLAFLLTMPIIDLIELWQQSRTIGRSQA